MELFKTKTRINLDHLEKKTKDIKWNSRSWNQYEHFFSAFFKKISLKREIVLCTKNIFIFYSNSSLENLFHAYIQWFKFQIHKTRFGQYVLAQSCVSLKTFQSYTINTGCRTFFPFWHRQRGIKTSSLYSINCAAVQPFLL